MSTTNLNDLEPGTPEYAAAEEAMLRAEDEEHGRAPAAGDEEATAAEAPPAEAKQADKPAEGDKPADEAKPDAPTLGVASKDGKRVLPYAALKGARDETRAERNARQVAERERDEARQALADLQAGKKSPGQMTQEQLDEFISDNPAGKAVVEELLATRERIEKLAKAQPKDEPKAESTEDPVQDAIDSLPTLADWQASDQDKFARAIEHDRLLMGSRKWKDKPMAERFAEATRLTAAEFDLQVEEDTPRTPEPQPDAKEDPKKALEKATPKPPNTLSDFKGGAADASRDSLNDRTPAARQVQQFSAMTDDEIDAHLARLG